MTAPGFGLRAARLLTLWMHYGREIAERTGAGRALVVETEAFIAAANDRPSCRAIPLPGDDR